jgi:hypothetical protein
MAQEPSLTREIVRFWSAPTFGFSAALFRIVFGALSLWTALGVALNGRRYFSEQGLIPWHVVSGFPWANWSLFALAPQSGALLAALCAALVIASCGLLLGVAPRLCSAVVFAVHVSLHHRNPYVFNSGDRLFLMLAGLGMFLPLGRVGSLTSRFRRAQSAPAARPPASVWSQRLIQLQICHLYWFSCLAKLKHEGWQRGLAMREVLASPPFAEWPMQVDGWLSALLTWSTLLFELGFPIAVWIPKLRRWALALGVVFHLGIEISMKIPMFSAIMIVSYALFLKDDEARRVLQVLRLAPRSTPSVSAAATAP